MHSITNLWTFLRNCSPKLQENNERQNALVALNLYDFRCLKNYVTLIEEIVCYNVLHYQQLSIERFYANNYQECTALSLNFPFSDDVSGASLPIHRYWTRGAIRDGTQTATGVAQVWSNNTRGRFIKVRRGWTASHQENLLLHQSKGEGNQSTQGQQT